MDVAHRDEVWSAVLAANAVLSEDVPFRFVPDWKRQTAASYERIPVMLVTRMAPSRGPTFVPTGSRVVIVDADEVEALPTILGRKRNGIPLSTERLLTVCLLHEAGHLYNHDSDVSAVPPAGQLNDEETHGKELERHADKFAADQIREAYEEHFPSRRMVAAMMIPAELQAVAFNLTGYRVIDKFGTSTLAPEQVFLDDSYTHPNTELRVLLINYYISPTEDAKELLEEFQQHRLDASHRYLEESR